MRWRLFAVFFGLAFLFRLLIAGQSGMFELQPPTEIEVIAQNVAESGSYNLFGGPTAYNTPIFPLYIAGLLSICGTVLAAHIVNVILTCAISALRCGLVPLFALEAGLDRKTSILAGGIGVLYIGAYATEISGGLDGPWVALALLALVWAAMRIWRDGRWQRRTTWWFFALCGFCALLNPSLLPVMGAFLVAGAVACPAATRRRYLQQAALALAGILIFLLPWGIRNYAELGAPILTRSNFGTEFWVSNGPGRTFDLPNNYDTYHPSSTAAEAFKWAQAGEVEYNRQRLANAMEWIRSDPREFLRLTGMRVAAWWFPPRPVVLLAPKLVLTLLAFGGLWILFRGQPLVGWLFLLTWIVFPVVYYVIEWSSRFRYPMDWQMLICASVAIMAGYRAVVGRAAVHSPGSHPEAP